MDAVRNAMPQYDYYFFGDTANVPYGDRSEEEVYELTKAGIRHLFEQDVLIAIVACNTASAETLRKLQDTFLVEEYPERRILGVIIPTVEHVIDSGCMQPLLIATQRTVDSGKYYAEFMKVSASYVTLQVQATPTLVPYLEKKDIDAACGVLAHVLTQYRGTFDALILGCTHYTLLKDYVRATYGDVCVVFSQDEIIPHKLLKYIESHQEFKMRLTHGGTMCRCFSGAVH